MSTCEQINPALARAAASSVGSALDLTVKKGADMDRIVFSLVSDVDQTEVDLTGASITAQARKLITDVGPAFSFAGTVISATQAALDLSAAAIASLPGGKDARDLAGKYIWSCIVTLPGNKPKAVFYGSITVLQNETR
jgi:hypothetical protein